MKKSFTKLFGALALAAGLLSVGNASAAVITGSLGYTSLGGFVANNNNLTVATEISFPGVAQVSGVVSGSFAAAGILPGDVITLTSPLSVNAALALPMTPIWSIAGFSLTLTSISELPGNVATSLGLTGTGTLSGPMGTTPSTGLWVATFNREGTNFTYSSSTTTINDVPEGGTALALLGLGLLGLEGARRKLTAAKA